MSLFGKKTAELSKTGVYSVSGKKLTPINRLPKRGSYDDIADDLGYPSYHGVSLSFDYSRKIEYIAFIKGTTEPIFLRVRNRAEALSYPEVYEAIRFGIDWSSEGED